MFYPIVDEKSKDCLWVLNLATMQRMNIRVVQKNLVELASEFHNTPPDDWPALRL
jgi:hypothetical protein